MSPLTISRLRCEASNLFQLRSHSSGYEFVYLPPYLTRRRLSRSCCARCTTYFVSSFQNFFLRPRPGRNPPQRNLARPADGLKGPLSEPRAKFPRAIRLLRPEPKSAIPLFSGVFQLYFGAVLSSTDLHCPVLSTTARTCPPCLKSVSLPRVNVTLRASQSIH